MAKTALKVPSGYVKVDGTCPHCAKAGDDSLLVQVAGGASCLNCGKTVPHLEIVREVVKEVKKKVE